MKNHYEILEVEPGASKQVIKMAYVELAKEAYRRYKNGDQKAQENYTAIQEAYEVLSDDTKRAEFDYKLAEGEIYTEPGIAEDFPFLREELSLSRNDLKFNRVQQFWQQRQEKTRTPNRNNRFKTIAGFIAVFLVLVVLTRIFFLSDDNNDEPHIGLNNTNINERVVSENVTGDKERTYTSARKPIFNLFLQTHDESNEKVVFPPTKIDNKNKKFEPIKTLEKVNQSTKERSLTEDEISNIINTINKSKESNSSIKCIKVVRSGNSNISNAFNLVPLLQKEGYAIAGRGNSKVTVNGFVIESRDNCLVITIGEF